ncbi:MAG: lipopolysaccharide biosynthesis protein [Limisphaerales bacterium]
MRRGLLTASSAVVARVISMAGPLITVPMVLHYLGHEQYGLWMTVTSLVGMFTFADLGLGNGLMTAISQAEGRCDVQESRRCVASAMFALTGVAMLLLCLYAICFHFLPWPRLLNTTSPVLLRESGAVVTVCFVTFLANLPFGVVQRVQCGLQQGFQSNCWQCAASAINVTVVLTAVKAHASLPVLVLGVSGVQPLVSLLNGCAFFGFQSPALRPRFRNFHWATARRLLGTGFWFFLVSILMAVGICSDNMVIDQVIGLDKVPLYSVPARLAVYLGTVASMLYLPFWTANGEALARGDVEWVRRNTARIMRWNVLILGIAGFAFAALGPLALHLWIGLQFSPGRSLFVGMAVWAFLTSVVGPLFMILNGANCVRVQVLIYGVFSTIAVILKVILARRIGIAGVVWASVLPFALIVAPTVAWVARQVLRRAEGTSLKNREGTDIPLESCDNPVINY